MMMPPFDALKSGTRTSSSARLLSISGLLAALAFFFGSTAISYLNIQTLRELTGKISHTHEVITGLEDIIPPSKMRRPASAAFC
jgi:CHASE3 domain sensor protein